MAAAETRLLVLAAVSIFGPVNGYQLGRELNTWRAQDWAELRPGSIYQSLSTFESRGLVERHDLPDGRRTVAVYEITERGRGELRAMFEAAMLTVNAANPLAFHTAISLNALVERETYLGLLRERLAPLDEALRGFDQLQDSGQAPPAVVAGAVLWRDLVSAERAWVADQVERIAAGEQVFAGEPPWAPPTDELSQALRSDRERYRSQLGSRRPA